MIWLIGNKGMLGSDVELALQEKNVPFITSDKEVDITDIAALRTYIKDIDVSWIINCSAYTAVDKAEDEIEIATRINADGVQNIAQIASEKEAKLIHFSTDYVFDGKKEGAYIEDDATGPTGVYGKSKLLGEFSIINELAEHFIFRISWLYGKHGNNFVFTMLRLMQERSELRVVGDQWGSPTYTGDLALFLITLIETGSNAFGIYHYSNEGKTNWHAFACEIYNQARQKGIIQKDVVIHSITTDEYPTKAIRPQNSYMSKEKVKNTFNIDIRSWQDALQEFLDEI